RELVGQAGEPERLSGFAQLHDIIGIDPDADALERALGARRALAGALGGAVRPPVVIAHDCMHAEWRLEARQLRGPEARLDEARDVAMPAHVVAEQHDQVSAEAVGLVNDRSDALLAHPWPAGMNVGDRRDSDVKPQWPARRPQIVARN